MNLLRPYEPTIINEDWIATQLGVREEQVKINNMFLAASNPSKYIDERNKNLSEISEYLARDYKTTRDKLKAQGLPEEKMNRLLTEIMKSKFSVEKAILDNAYEESDMILFKGMTKNLTPGNDAEKKVIKTLEE